MSSIPFDVTASTVSRLIRAKNPPDDAYLIVQQEAAERFVGAPRCTLVAALTFPRFEATVVHAFDRRDFVPAPRVEVVMLRLRKRGPPLVKPESQVYRDLVVAGVHSAHGFNPRDSEIASREAAWLTARATVLEDSG